MRVLLSRLCVVCVCYRSNARVMRYVWWSNINIRKCARFFLCRVSVCRVCNEETPPNVVRVHIISRLIFFYFCLNNTTTNEKDGGTCAFVAPFSTLRVAAAERAERAQPTTEWKFSKKRAQHSSRIIIIIISVVFQTKRATNERERDMQ